MKLLLDNLTGKEVFPKTEFEVIKRKNILSFHFIAHDSSLISYSNKDNDELWRGNVVEVFLSLGDDFYYEFEVAPSGAAFVATILNRQITFINNDFFSSICKRSNNQYEVIMNVDLSKLKHNNNIEYNAFRIEMVNERQILEALNPTLCNTFHVREKFMRLEQ